MVETDIFPTTGGMTARTIPAEQAFVYIIRRMTGETILRSPLIDPVYVAACACAGLMKTR
jgi:hypothetical protein